MVVEPFEIEVDGERFQVVEDAEQDSTFHYTWLCGPRRGYGFTSRRSRPGVLGLPDHERRVRSFLADLDESEPVDPPPSGGRRAG